MDHIVTIWSSKTAENDWNARLLCVEIADNVSGSLSTATGFGHSGIYISWLGFHDSLTIFERTAGSFGHQTSSFDQLAYRDLTTGRLQPWHGIVRVRHVSLQFLI